MKSFHGRLWGWYHVCMIPPMALGIELWDVRLGHMLLTLHNVKPKLNVFLLWSVFVISLLDD